MRVIITGGTGLIGRALVEVLAPQGHEIIILSRDPTLASPAIRQQPNIETLGWDGRTAGGWGHLITAESAIINLAGASPAHWRWTASHKALIRESRLNAIAAITQAIERHGPPEVLVQASASGYYGNRGDEPLVETSPPGRGFRADVCQVVEAAIAAASGCRRCIARTGIVLDTHAGAFPPLLLFARMLGRQLGTGHQWIPWIHRRDAARAIQFLIEQRDCSGPYNLCAPAVATNRDFLRAVHHVLWQPAIFPLPAFVPRALLGEEASVILDSQRMLPQRLLRTGFTFEYPHLEQALRQLLA
ncbi:MAG: TIGR01777 family oxidoreductase [Nitrososphaerota archaeon]